MAHEAPTEKATTLRGFDYDEIKLDSSSDADLRADGWTESEDRTGFWSKPWKHDPATMAVYIREGTWENMKG